MKFLARHLMPFWLAVACAASSFAQVSAVVTGPPQTDPGDLVILDASTSKGTAFQWVLVGSKKTFLPIEGGKKVVFASGQPGRYQFVLVVGGAGADNSLAVATAEFDLLIGDPPLPNPTPLPTPIPNPVPNPPTPPVPTPVTEGKRLLILCRSSEGTSPQLAQGIIRLRAGPAAEYLTQKKHRFLNLSAMEPFPPGYGANAQAAWEKLKMLKLPAIAIVASDMADSSGLLFVESLKLDATDVDILDILKRFGG